MKDIIDKIELYQMMYLIRRSEQKIQEYYLEDEMKTPMHMSTGSEAVVVGVTSALAPEDQVSGTYRSHALYLSKSGNVRAFFHELYGKMGGAADGKAGSMHLLDLPKGLICTSAIVGTNIPVGVGAALANKMQGFDRVVAVFFGDGALDEGSFWESMNFAILKKLKIIFVLEDNGYAVHVPKNLRQSFDNICDIASDLGAITFYSKSTNVEDIYCLAKDAIGSTCRLAVPSFMHLKYYRYLEHVGVFEDFKAGYRPKAKFEEWFVKDPVKLCRNSLVHTYSEEIVEKVESDINRLIDDSIASAKAAPFPEIA